MIPYFIHASVLLAAFFIFYWLLLRQETFYRINRAYFLFAVLASFALPLIIIPESWSLHTLSKDAEQIHETPVLRTAELAERSEAEAATESEAIANVNTSVASEASASFVTTAIAYFRKAGVKKIAWMIYLAGVTVFTITFFIQFVLILINRSKLQYIQDGKYRIYELTDDSSPFSFLNWIFINPGIYDLETFNQILAHEKIHVSQAHYIDKLLAEVIIIFCWFNPFAWMYRRSITDNLEFLTDEEMLGQGTEKQSYQMSLLKVSVPQHALSLTTNYNQSFLAQRIKMMDSRKSSAQSSWKYLLIFPLIALSMAGMNGATQDENLSEAARDALKPSEHHIAYMCHNELEEIDSIPPDLNQAGNEKVIDMNASTFSNTKQKTKKKTKHKVKNKLKDKDKLKDKAKKKNKDQWDYDKVAPGQWQGRIKENEVCFYINNSKPRMNNTWQVHECFSKVEMGELPMDTRGTFEIKREPGTLKMTGFFSGDQGLGDFEFLENKEFSAFLKKELNEAPSVYDMFQIFINNTGRNFVTDIKNLGYAPGVRNIIELGIHARDLETIQEFQRIGKLAGLEKPSMQKMVEMAIHDVDEEIYKKYFEFKIS